MSLSLIVVALGAVVAAVGTGVLTARCARDPRSYLVAWAVGLFGLAISLGAQALGYLTGYSALMFRAMELGAQVIAPLAICLGLGELVGRTVPARFAMRLAVSAITVIAVVILGTDPLNPVATFTKRWPNPAVFYEFVPRALLEYLLGPFTALVAVCAVIVALWRSSRQRRGPAALLLPVLAAAAGALALALPGLALLVQHAGLALAAPNRIFGPVCLLAAGLTWLAAVQARRAGAAEERAGPRGARYGAADLDGPDGYPGAVPWHDQDAGLPGSYRAGELDGYGPGADQAAGRNEPADVGAAYSSAGYGDDAEYGGNGPDAAVAGSPFAGHDPDGPYPALAALVAESDDPPAEAGRYRGEAALSGAAEPYAAPVRGGGPGPYSVEAGFGPGSKFGNPGPFGGRGGHQPADEVPQAQLFGQIAIYTLIEDRIDDFDRLTERVVAQVRAREPDTLVYIVHAVPTAPMQRLLYEVYRDRAAYDDHLQRPYVVRYEAERRPFVLAANVIEVGLQQAKVSPLPSISDILSESGIDLTGVTRSPRGVAPPPGGESPATRPAGPPAEWLPAAVPPAPAPPEGQAGQSGYDPQYQGWTELRGEGPRYR